MGFKIIAGMFILILLGFSMVGFAATYVILVKRAEEEKSDQENE